MRKAIVITTITIVLTASSFAQGTVVFANSTNTLITLPDGAGLPVGSTFRVELMYAPDGTPDTVFELVAIRLGSAIGIGPRPGVFSGGIRTAPTPTPGGYGLFQVRSWEAEFGASYAEAAAAPPNNGRYALAGKSDILRVFTGDPTPQNPPSEPGSLIGPGLGFTLQPVPEPSVTVLAIAALLVGAAWQIVGRRK